jgi:hypothetical protein
MELKEVGEEDYVVEALRYKPVGSIPDGVIGIFH